MTAFGSYWLDTAPGFTGAAADPEPHYDVAVVGAGLTGLTAARVLAKAGQKVAVFERGQVGAGASGRNGGHLNNGLAHSFADAAARLGRDGARRLYHAYDAAIDRIEATIAEEGIACDFRRSGKLKLAAKPSHVAALRANFEEIHREADPDTAFLTKDDLAGEIRTDAAHAGLLYRKSAMMHMGRYLHGLATAVARHGGQIFETCPVTQVRRDGPAWRVATARGSVAARHLILAGGATGAGLTPALARQILPIGSYVIATRPLTHAEIAATLPSNRTYVTSRNLGHYFRLAADRRLIFGGRARFSTREDTQAAAKALPLLQRALAEMFPPLADIEVDYAFGGLVDMTRDRLPRVGRLATGALFAIGYSGHGAQLSTVFGNHLAERALGHSDGACELSFGRLKTNTFPLGARTAAPALSWYFRVKDLLS